MAMILAQTTGSTSWLSSVWSIFLLIIGFSLVIFVHELGHFLAAKWAKVRVEKFCIGFGKELFGFTRGDTRYGFNVLPLGGYVKMMGQEDFVVDKSGELKVKDDPNSFTNKSIGKRMVIISAGVIMNLLFAAVAFAIVVMVGRLEMPSVIGNVAENTPAERAGLQTGDRITKINGREIRTFGELSAAVMLSDPGETLELTVERDGKIVKPKPKVLPEFKENEQVRQIGIGTAMNLRVLTPSLRLDEAHLPDELQKYDEFSGLLVGGAVKAFKGLGPFARAVEVARGAPVEIVVRRPVEPDALTDEICLKSVPEIETTEARVHVRALWVPLAYERQPSLSGSLLGLMPRLTVLIPTPGKSFEKAGAQTGDVIVKIGSHSYPTLDELKEVIEESADTEVLIDVRRTRAANHGLSAWTVEFCVVNRETLIVTALQNPAAALEKAAELAESAGLPEAEQDKLLAMLKDAGDGPGWRRWLENVDVHRLDPIMPKHPFSLFGMLGLAEKAPPPVDALLVSWDEDHLVVSQTKENLGDRLSPAKAAGIPDGAVILTADGQPVRQWYELSNIFQANAGRTIALTYRVADEVHTTAMAIPSCLTATLNLPTGARIVKIDGKTSYPIKVGDEDKDETEDISLPDWRATEGLLKASIGKTVQVEYVTYEGERHTASYAVTAENTDPWLHRVRFAPSFGCYPLRERHPIHNPIVAVGVGFRQAYDATMQTIQSIRHMIFTRQVGVSKVSGPVGIVRMGSRFADSGLLNLLWFLAVISANLAVINFLPLPIVDGGLFLFLIMEKLRGEPVSIKTQIATQLIGIALIATVFLLITYQDIKNWILGA